MQRCVCVRARVLVWFIGVNMRKSVANVFVSLCGGGGGDGVCHSQIAARPDVEFLWLFITHFLICFSKVDGTENGI